MNDNLNREVFVEDKEIDLKDMLSYICKRWRSIGIVSLATMVVMILVKIPVLIEMKGIGTILKQLGKYAAIGVFAGLFLMCVVYAIAYLTSDKIKSENEFQTICRLDILGVLPQTQGKKNNSIDKFIMRAFGVNRSIEDFDSLIDRLAEEIKAVLLVKNIEKNNLNSKICLTIISTQSYEITEKIADLLNSKISDIATTVVAGNILNSAKSVRTVMESNQVLIVEKLGSSKYQMLEESYKKINKWNKNVIGIVLVDEER